MKVAITTTSFAERDSTPLDALVGAGLDVIVNDKRRKLTSAETVTLCGECVGILAGTEQYDEQTLGSLGKLRVLSRIGAGLDNVNLLAAAALGIEVRNTPDGPTDAVAELTIALMLDMLRHVSAMDKNMRAGVWEKRMGNLLSCKRVGIVGLGRIGSRVAGHLAALGCDVAYCDVRPQDDSVQHVQMSFEDLLAWADIVTIHCTAPGSTCAAMIGHAELNLMRPGTWLVNASRSELVDESALIESIRSGHLAGAAIDVFAEEPYSGQLIGLDNVVLTPHAGSYAAECRNRMEMDAVRNLLDVLRV